MYLDTDIARAEAIALLTIICPSGPATPSAASPTSPSSSTTSVDNDAGRDHDGGRRRHHQLSLRHERALVSALACLSGVSNDPDRAAAVSVSETGPASLNVLVAVHRSGRRDGEDVMGRVRDGFGRVFAALRLVGDADGDIGLHSDRVLDAIVYMCHNRILALTHLFDPVNPVTVRLREAIVACLAAAPPPRPSPRRGADANPDADADGDADRQPLLASLRHVLALAPQHRRIPDLVDSFRRLSRTPGAWTLAPELRRVAGRVARYRDAADVLVALARRYPAVRAMAFVAAEGALDGHVAGPEGGAAGGHVPRLSHALERICRQANISLWTPERLARHVIIGPGGRTSPDAIQAVFAARVGAALGRGQIHAEVQLATAAAHLQHQRQQPPPQHRQPQHQQPLRPRVIYASKQTCYLCRTLLRSRFRLSSGRYDGGAAAGPVSYLWRLPARHQQAGWIGDVHVQETFRRELDGAVARALRGLAAGQSVRLSPSPANEAAPAGWENEHDDDDDDERGMGAARSDLEPDLELDSDLESEISHLYHSPRTSSVGAVAATDTTSSPPPPPPPPSPSPTSLTTSTRSGPGGGGGTLSYTLSPASALSLSSSASPHASSRAGSSSSTLPTTAPPPSVPETTVLSCPGEIIRGRVRVGGSHTVRIGPSLALHLEYSSTRRPELGFTVEWLDWKGARAVVGRKRRRRAEFAVKVQGRIGDGQAEGEGRGYILLGGEVVRIVLD